MPTDRQEYYPQTCVLDVPAGHLESGANLEDYIAEATQKLETISELAAGHSTIDTDSREWMLAQVDFIVETVGNDSLDLDDAMRSNLLQLLLAIANLNEQIRHEAALNA